MKLKTTLLPGLIVALAVGRCGRAAMEPLVSTENMCGSIALACAARAAGSPVDIERLVEQLPLDGEMKSFADLESAANKLGLVTRVVRWRPSQAPSVQLPCIVRLLPDGARKEPHFVVAVASLRGAVRVLDPPRPAVWISDRELFRTWDGIALYVANDRATLAAAAPSYSPLGNRSFMSIALAGALILVSLTIFGKRRQPAESQGRRDGRAGLGPKGLACAGWAAAAIGISWMVMGHLAAPLRIVSVDTPTLDVEVSDTTVKENGGWIKTNFVLRNHSGQAAVIAGLTTNCKCVKARAPRGGVIPALGSAPIEVELDLQDQPSREASVVVELEDARPEQLMLRLRARKYRAAATR
jgi:predicted double-glycine peptidase